MAYTAASINTSATIVAPAAATADVRGKAVKFNENGEAVVASVAGEVVMGIALITNDEEVQAGHDVDIQVKEIGLALAAGAIAAGDELAAGATGALVKAAEGNFVVATALEAAEAAGRIIRVQITKYQK